MDKDTFFLAHSINQQQTPRKQEDLRTINKPYYHQLIESLSNYQTTNFRLGQIRSITYITQQHRRTIAIVDFWSLSPPKKLKIFLLNICVMYKFIFKMFKLTSSPSFAIAYQCCGFYTPTRHQLLFFQPCLNDDKTF